MSCICHGTTGERVEGRTEPDSQCTTCALKHVEMAMEAWGEFTYEEDNRRWVARHLRLAVEHLKTDHYDTARRCREIANIVELALDADRSDVSSRLSALKDEALGLFKADHPEYIARLSRLKDLQ